MVNCEYCGRRGFKVINSHYNACKMKQLEDRRQIQIEVTKKNKVAFEREQLKLKNASEKKRKYKSELKKKIEQEVTKKLEAKFEQELKLRKEIREEEQQKNTGNTYHIDNSVNTTNILTINTQEQISEINNDFMAFLQKVKKLVPILIQKGVPRDQIGVKVGEIALKDQDKSTQRIIQIINGGHEFEYECIEGADTDKVVKHIDANLVILNNELKKHGIGIIRPDQE